MLGVALVQWPSSDAPITSEDSSKDRSRIIGLLAVLTSCFSSAFSGVYFEKLVKYTNKSLWISNIEMAIFGFILGMAAVFVQDLEAVRSNGFFQGYNSITWIVILLQAVGGLIVAVVMKYADNILKGLND